MSLIEINIPEEDGWRDDVASRVLLVMLAAMFLRLGIRIWAGVAPEGLIAALPTFACYAVATQLTIFAVSDIDLERWGRVISYVIVTILTFLVVVILVATGESWIPSLNTDGLAFTHVSLELLSQGRNPMAASMAPALDLRGAGEFWTHRVDGSIVLSWSYPAGLFAAYLPQWLVIGAGPVGIRLTSVLVVGLLGGVLTWMLPARLALAAPLSLALPRNEWLTAAGGITDMMWVLPTAIALYCWATDRRLTAAAALGLAAGTKQHPWAILPFLAVWVWHESGGLEEFASSAVRLCGAGLAGFLAVNLPFILWNPNAWLSSVFTPLGSAGAPLVSEGSGLAVFHMAGLEIPRWVFKAAVATVTLGYLAAYWRWFDRLRWTAWVAPMAIYFVHSRSLASYFNWFIPLAVIALLAAHGRLRRQGYVRA